MGTGEGTRTICGQKQRVVPFAGRIAQRSLVLLTLGRAPPREEGLERKPVAREELVDKVGHVVEGALDPRDVLSEWRVWSFVARGGRSVNRRTIAPADEAERSHQVTACIHARPCLALCRALRIESAVVVRRHARHVKKKVLQALKVASLREVERKAERMDLSELRAEEGRVRLGGTWSPTVAICWLLVRAGAVARRLPLSYQAIEQRTQALEPGIEAHVRWLSLVGTRRGVLGLVLSARAVVISVRAVGLVLRLGRRLGAHLLASRVLKGNRLDRVELRTELGLEGESVREALPEAAGEQVERRVFGAELLLDLVWRQRSSRLERGGVEAELRNLSRTKDLRRAADM